VVEADDEAGHHLQAVALNLLHGSEQVAANVLPLLGLLETRLNRGLNPDEDVTEGARRILSNTSSSARFTLASAIKENG
jgi:hypothetical protein